MRKARIFLVALTAVLAVGGAAWGIYEWRESRRWPFATGTNDPAFLSTTFGMSPPEARRALARVGARLLTEAEFRDAERGLRANDFDSLTIFLPSSFVPLFPEDEQRSLALYMPAVELFGAAARARFEFWDNRLSYVETEIDPISAAGAQETANTIDRELRKTSTFDRREDSQEVPGAYTLFYVTPRVQPQLWVNLVDPKKPIVILRILHPPTQDARRREVEDRERTAFGR